jgi:SsrA-binding protein
VARNRKACHEYFIESTYHAGIELTGTEVKSLRAGHGSINEAYAGDRDGEIFLINSHIPEYSSGGMFNHEPKRDRKLLLHRREIARLLGSVQRQGMTVVPLSVYFDARGMAKVELALARGKHSYDKREAVKDRDWQRQKARLMREKG